MTPQSRKSGHGPLLRCRSGLDAGPFEKTFVDDVRKKNIGQKPGKSSPSVRVQHRNRSGVVENGVTKSCQIFCQKTGKTQFWPKIFHFFEQDEDRLLFATRESRRDRISDKNSRNRKRKILGQRFFFQKWVRIPLFLYFFGCGKTHLWGGYNFKNG